MRNYDIKKVKVHFLLLAFLQTFLLTACNPYSEPEIPEYVQELDNVTIFSIEATPPSTIHLSREQAFGDIGDLLLGSIGEIDVANNGQVFISDPVQNVTFVFEADGQHKETLGREGSGPGEFRSIHTVDIAGKHLYVYDFSLRRISKFDLELFSLVDTIPLGSVDRLKNEEPAGVFSPRSIYVRDSEFILMQISPLMQTPPTSAGQKIDDLYREYYRVDYDGTILPGKVYEQKDLIWLTAQIDGRIQFTTNVPFLGKSLFQVSKDGSMYSAWSEDFLIEVRNSSGEYQYAFYYPFIKKDLVREDALQSMELDFHRRVIQQNELHETWPALNDLIIDDENRLWVSAIVEDFDIYEWWVLEETGELIAKFEWPRDEPIEIVKNGFVYTRETDEETGLQQIVRYRVEMEDV